ncbi:MAG: hypothetical protein AAF573_13410 [Bacteroidota bacterium]
MSIMTLIRKSVRARFSGLEKAKISQKREAINSSKFDELYQDNEDLGFC